MTAPMHRCQSCGQIIRTSKSRVYIVKSSCDWLGFQYRDPDQPMTAEECHIERGLTRAEAKAFLRFFRDEMGFAKATAWRAVRFEERSTSFKKARF